LIDKKFTTEKEFLDALKKRLRAEDVTKFKEKDGSLVLVNEARKGTKIRIHFNYVWGTVESAEGDKCVIVEKGVEKGKEAKRYTCKPYRDAGLTIYGADGKPTKDKLSSLKKGQEVYFQPIYVNREAEPYRTAPEALVAFQNWWNRQALPKEKVQVAPDTGLGWLLEINLEAVYPRYCSNLASYVDRLKQENKLSPRLQAREKPPKGAGWVVELRGYTYHKDQDRYLKDTLVWKLGTFRHKEQEVEVSTLYLKRPEGAPAEQPHGNDPVEGHVSYAVLYDYKFCYSPSEYGQMALRGGVVADLVGGSKGSDKGESGMLGVGAKGAGGGGSWTPLGNNLGSGKAGGGGNPGGGGGAAVGRRDGGSRPELMQGGAAVGPDAGAKDKPKETKTDQGTLKRTEFIMLFIWEEPTPSDQPVTPDAKPASGGAGSKSGGAAAKPVGISK
jgi:hypothetical protein